MKELMYRCQSRSSKSRQPKTLCRRHWPMLVANHRLAVQFSFEQRAFMLLRVVVSPSRG